NADVLFPYLPEHWVEHIQLSRFKGPTDTAYPPQAPSSVRPDVPTGSGSPVSDLAILRSEVLDRPGIERAILNCAYAIESLHHPDAAVALASAVNDWLIAEWLDREPR